MALLRVALSAVVAFDLVSFVVFLADARERAVVAGVTADAPTWFVASSPVSIAAAALGIAAICRFAWRPGELAAGAVALAVLAAFSHSLAALVGSPWRHLYFSGLTLLGWLAGLALARRRGASSDEGYARTGATALLGAAYLNAGLSKLVYGGTAWLGGATIRYTVIAQSGLVGDGLLSWLRQSVVDDVRVAAVLAIATVVFELLGVLFVVGPRARAVVALGLVGMHVSIFVLTGIPYVESIALLLLFGLPVVPESASHTLEGPRASRTAVGLVALGIVALLGLAREITSGRPGPGARLEPRAALVTAPARVGPFALGDELAGFELVELRADPESLFLRLAQDEQEISFDLSCTGGFAGPFDRGPVHLLYRRTALPLTALEPSAHAIVDRVLADPAGADDPCVDLEEWLAAARADGASPE